MRYPKIPVAYISEDYLIWHLWEGKLLVLWRLDASTKGDARVVRLKWVGEGVSSYRQGMGDGVGDFQKGNQEGNNISNINN